MLVDTYSRRRGTASCHGNVLTRIGSVATGKATTCKTESNPRFQPRKDSKDQRSPSCGACGTVCNSASV